MAEFNVRGRAYKSVRLSPKTQLFVIKRLGRIVPAFKDAVDSAKKSGVSLTDVAGTSVTQDQLSSVATTLKPVLEAFSSMPDQDLDFIINSCLSVTETPNVGAPGWMRLMNGSGDLMFHDLTMVDMAAVAWFVIKDSINLNELFSLTSDKS